MKVCILDYGSGNVRSVYNLVLAITSNVCVSNSEDEINAASHLVLPGVGSFESVISKVRSTLPINLILERICINKTPFLGICVGMQILATSGMEFGEHDGLGIIPGVVDLVKSEGQNLPHVGWNSVNFSSENELFSGIKSGEDFYFVHSYAMMPKNVEHIISTTFYGENFCSAIQHENIFGVQFHPEKSQIAGKKLFTNFLNI